MMVIVGGPDDNSLTGATWIYPFTRSTGTYAQYGSKFVSSTSAAGSKVGTAVAIDQTGTWFVTCGPGDGSGIGACWTYVNTPGTYIYTENAKLRGNDYTGTPNMGNSVAMNALGTTIIIGAEVGNTFWVFNRQGFSWFQMGPKFAVPNLSVGGIGASVAMDSMGGTVAVGIPLDGTTPDGSVVIYY
jgi:hypothetical protein